MARWDLTQFSQSPSAALPCFPESHGQSEISSLSKVILVLGKARSRRAPSLGSRGSESPGWSDVSPKNSARDVMPKGGVLSGWSCQSPAAHSCSLLTYPKVSVEECSRLMQNLMQILCSSHSVILNAMATQYTCSFNSIYHPQWLVQWSCHCSSMHTPVHSPWLPGYINVVQTILIILTMAGLFLDRPHCICLLLKTLYSADNQSIHEEFTCICNSTQCTQMQSSLNICMSKIIPTSNPSRGTC